MTNITRLKLCFVALAVTLAAASDVELNFNANGPALNDVCGLTVDNNAVFWAVGDQGKVFKVENGSIITEYTLSGGDYDLHGVSFADGDHGWIVGYRRYDQNDPGSWRRGVVFRTTTGGGNADQWDPDCPEVQTGINVPFLKVQAVNNNTVWLTCGDGYVLWSGTGGLYWSVRTKPGGAGDYSYLWGLWAFDALCAWVASDESLMIAKTTDGGATWSAYRPFPDDSLSYRGIGPWDSYQPDFTKVALAASRGRVVHTTNGGSNWVEETPLNGTCQWWRGISHDPIGSAEDWVGTSGTWLRGQSYGSHGNPRCSKKYDINDVEETNSWHIAVGTHEAIYASHDDTPGLPEGLELEYIDAVSQPSPSEDVLVNVHVYNWDPNPVIGHVHVYRSICQEDLGTDQARFYQLLDDVGNIAFSPGENTFYRYYTCAYNVPYWYGATLGGLGYSASPNVDSARALGATPYGPLPSPASLQATDVAGDHGWNEQFDWPSNQFATGYALIRLPQNNYVHPYHYGHKGGLIAVTEGQQATTAYDTLMLPGYEYRRGVRSLDGVTSSITPAETYAASVDNVVPPTVTGLSVRYVTLLDALEVWWNPIPESGEPGGPETYEPNLGGYWVCPYVAGAALDDDPHDTHLNHPSPLFRNHYITSIAEEAYGHDWCFSVCARDRTGNRGDWCVDASGTIPNLASTSPLATAYNNGAHLARVPNTATEHVVYESNGEIHYARSTDGGNEWHNRTVLDSGTSPALATNGNTSWVVYLKDNVVRYKVGNSSAVWGSSGVLFNPDDANVIPGPPAVAIPLTATPEDPEYAFAAFPVYDLNAGASSVKVVKFDGTTSTTVTVDAEPSFALSDSFVSLSLTPGDIIHCCWQRGSTILYSQATANPDEWESFAWSEPYVLSQPGTVAKHPFCEASGDSVFAVWSDHGEGEIMRVERLVAAPLEAWSAPVNVSNTAEFSDYPQTSIPSAVSWQDLMEDETWEFRVRVGGDLVNLSSSPDRNSCFGHISLGYALWTEGPMEGGYYEVKTCYYESITPGGQMAAGLVPVTATELSSAAPNPFRRNTGIRYQLARPGHTKLSIFDATGRAVRTLVNSEQEPGSYAVTWDGTDSRRRILPKGIYFVRFDAPEYSGQMKLALTR